MDNWNIGYKMVDFINERLDYGKQILELGSGAGTTQLVKKWNVCSIEENLEFINLHHNNYIHCPIVDGWYDIRPLMKLNRFEWDLLLIDGPAYGSRFNMINHINLFNFRAGQIIIADDVERDNDLLMLNDLEKRLKKSFNIEREEFDSISTKRFAVLTLASL